MLGRYKLAKIFFLSSVSILVVLFATLYWYSVPLIKKEIYQVELSASRLVLNNIFELANKMYSNVETYEQEAIKAHELNLTSIVNLTQNHIQQAIAQGKRQGLSQQQALKQFYQDLRQYQYGNHDYIWIADKNYHLLSHPDSRFHQTSASQLKDANGELIIPKIIDDVLEKGDGFYRYSWHRLGEVEAVEKISYVKYFPEWEFFIGTGVYLDDIKLEVEHRRQQAIAELRQALREIVIAKTGYLFVFDEQGNMLAHPNPNIDETNALTLKDPVTGNSILQELKDVADTGKELAYKWDRPTDPDNYIYDKLSLVRHLEGFGWYICSSVYVDELQSSSQLLSQRILVIGLMSLFVAIFLAFWFSKWITRPISQLAETAKKVSKGDLTARANIQRKDELGLLANTFDDMVRQLKQNIDKQAQLQLAEAQRMNSVGQLAGGLAHDFNNILTVVLGNLLILKNDYPQEKNITSHIEPVIRAAKRGSDITSRLLAFSRRQSLSPKYLHVAEFITESLKLIRGTVSSSIAIEFDADDCTNGCSYLDDTLFENCLVNLILNSRDAIKGHNIRDGRIKLNLSQRHVASDEDSFDDAVVEGEYLQLVIEDNGGGFSADALQQAFDPFFTTKSGSDGSGLGLSMVYGFIKQSQGYIKIENTPNDEGARIVMLLPASDDLEDDVSLTTADTELVQNFEGKLIMLVEDNADVRDIIRQQLLQYGFNIIEAADADEAIELSEHLDNVYALVSDISMPGQCDGFGLANIFAKQHTESKIVLMSAYAYNTDNENPFPVLQKPFDITSLIQLLSHNNK